MSPAVRTINRASKAGSASVDAVGAAVLHVVEGKPLWLKEQVPWMSGRGAFQKENVISTKALK